ncbi:sigma-54 interaction domain-containing protein [Siminovitchia sp. 179-K 8D1 HS]|uniref:sigma-54 interaction domain-containing protein n=1 Tax=Siminovitchia sp. 179-K 8D1 HS TaxID=3142385 RepID=UPI0039A25645
MSVNSRDLSVLLDKSQLERFISCIDSAVVLFDGRGNPICLNERGKALNRSVNLSNLHQNLKKTKHSSNNSRFQEITINKKQYVHYSRIIQLNSIEVVFDTFEKKQRDHKEVLLNDELHYVINSVQEGIYITDSKGFTLKINDAYSKMTNINKSEVEGKHVSELILSDYFDESITLKVMKFKQKVSILQKIKGGRIWLVRGNPVLDNKGNIILIINTVYDMTKLNSLQEDLKKQSISIKKQEEEIRRLRSMVNDVPGLIAQSKSMRAILDRIKRLSSVDTSILILGETGTGKNLIAEKIHSSSQRKNKPFIEVNCGAIPEQLFESELFGFKKGAFTGADRNGKVGLIEAANEGTLFLDEIGELPINLQVKLLSVLQNKRVRKVGDITDTPVDVRIIAATNKDPLELIQQKLLREDLYYRLSVVPLKLPPLRERKEDIYVLTNFFLEKFNKKHQKDVQLLNSVYFAFETYNWPGNVRELEHVVEQIVVLADGDIVDSADLPPQFHMKGSDNPLTSEPSETRTLKEIVNDIERKYILNLWNEYKDIYLVAKKLGIHRTTLLRKAEKLNLELSIDQLR